MDQLLTDLLAWGSAASWLSVNSMLAVLAATFFVTAVLMAIGVPGVIVPLSLTSGAILDAELAALAVAAGAMAGSQALFLAARYSLQNQMRERLGARLERFERAFERRGAWYVLGLRLVGAPTLVLTGACALLPINQAKFALASFAGFFPAAFLAASVGSAI